MAEYYRLRLSDKAGSSGEKTIYLAVENNKLEILAEDDFLFGSSYLEQMTEESLKEVLRRVKTVKLNPKPSNF